ncbi:hypothetical protein TNCV_2303371 [Trichonephila clavipes]|nr:hypothetical protein TNCV_2303371 [Trichonephila clavipes]
MRARANCAHLSIRGHWALRFMSRCPDQVLNRVPLRMDFTEINSRGEAGRVMGRIDRQNSRFQTAKTIIIKFGLHTSLVELESGKSALNEVPKSQRQYNSGHFIQEIQPLIPIVQFTGNIFDIPVHLQWSCLVSLN